MLTGNEKITITPDTRENIEQSGYEDIALADGIVLSDDLQESDYLDYTPDEEITLMDDLFSAGLIDEETANWDYYDLLWLAADELGGKYEEIAADKVDWQPVEPASTDIPKMPKNDVIESDITEDLPVDIESTLEQENADIERAIEILHRQIMAHGGYPEGYEPKDGRATTISSSLAEAPVEIDPQEDDDLSELEKIMLDPESFDYDEDFADDYFGWQQIKANAEKDEAEWNELVERALSDFDSPYADEDGMIDEEAETDELYALLSDADDIDGLYIDENDDEESGESDVGVLDDDALESGTDDFPVVFIDKDPERDDEETPLTRGHIKGIYELGYRDGYSGAIDDGVVPVKEDGLIAAEGATADAIAPELPQDAQAYIVLDPIAVTDDELARALKAERLRARAEGRLPKKAQKRNAVPYPVFVLLKIAIAVVVILTLLFGVFGLYRLSDVSMAPALGGGDIALVYRLDKDYKHGDITLVKYDGETMAGRIVATEGEVVDIKNGELYVDNKRYASEAEITGKTEAFNEGVTFPYTVPKGEVFVLGDNRENATDSRIYGSAKIDETYGTVMMAMSRFDA